MAVPVRDETGVVAAALSVVLRRDEPVEPALVELHARQRDIERALGFRGLSSSFPFNGNVRRRMPRTDLTLGVRHPL